MAPDSLLKTSPSCLLCVCVRVSVSGSSQQIFKHTYTVKTHRNTYLCLLTSESEVFFLTKQTKKQEKETSCHSEKTKTLIAWTFNESPLCLLL